jgi:cytochrome c oxidase subunit II
MNEKPGNSKGINWGFFFLSGILVIIPTWLIAFHALDGGAGYISPKNLPLDMSGQGTGVDNLIYWVHYLMAALFVGWIGYFFYVLFRYNKGRNPRADYYGVQHHGSTWLEIAVALVEGVLLLGFAIPLWAKAVEKFPGEKGSTVIRVVGQQFQWNGWYPGANGVFVAANRKLVSSDNPFGFDKKDPNAKSNFTIVNDFEVPVNKPVICYVSSRDVIHCFACRPMRVTQDAIPGMSVPAWFLPKALGTYQLNCAQLCGNSHYAMRGTIKVVSQTDYDKWVAAKSAAAGAAGGAGGGFE